MIPHDLQSVRGKSTLRKKKKKTKTTPMEEKDGTLSQNVGHHQQVETKSDKLKSLEAYLENRYSSNALMTSEASATTKKKKRRKKKAAAGTDNLLVVDTNTGGIPSATGGDGDDDNDGVGGYDLKAGEDAPVVVNAEDVERERLLRDKINIKRSNQKWQTVSEGVRQRKQVSAEEEEEEEDLEVPRGRGRHDSSPEPDAGPSRSTRHDSSDEEEGGGGDFSPPRRSSGGARGRHDSDDVDDDDSDLDVRRRGGGRSQRYDSSDSEEDRRGASRVGGRSRSRSSASRDDSDSDSDLDVRRRARRSDEDDPSREQGIKQAKVLSSKPNEGGPKMLDGTSTGLVSSKVLREELERKRLEKVRKFEEMDPSVSGKAAGTVYRDKATGSRVTAEELAQRDSDQQVKHTRPLWSAGLAQKKRRKDQMEDLYDGGASASKKHDSELKQRIRSGDPMAHLVSSASKTATGGEEAAERDDFYSNRFGVSLQELREDGYVIPDGVPSHSWLKRGVGCPENRFGIKPGRFWDGRDRSNGFERDYFREMNRKRHRDKLAFMWSQEDM